MINPTKTKINAVVQPVTASGRAARRRLKQTINNASKEIQNVSTITMLGFKLGERKLSIIIPANEATTTPSLI